MEWPGGTTTSGGLPSCLGGICRSCSQAANAWSSLWTPDQLIKLSVGGSVYRVSKKEMLAAGSPLLTEVIKAGPGDDSEYFLDRDGTYFHLTLDFIRHGKQAFVSEASSGEHAVHVSYEVRRRLLLEAKVLGLSSMRLALEELSISTPQTSASGREARNAIQSSYAAVFVRSESDLPILHCILQEETKKKGLECFTCCNPIAITYIPPNE
eukprot:TRINITY_DN59294_c0_g1_i1.p1 TRINITY_DN59294_c0_g1~~TRINITY_DN59294_c0_g1_i1.p1  ORF type:complete len:210 (-),score=37.93 TRINITY_DN59294_c0_g1_i1:49-678(-)